VDDADPQLEVGPLSFSRGIRGAVSRMTKNLTDTATIVKNEAGISKQIHRNPTLINGAFINHTAAIGVSIYAKG
jgi:hypothetical protein